MAQSSLYPIFSVLDKLQKWLSTDASSSSPSYDPKLKKLNDMVYEVYRPSPPEIPKLEVVFFHGLQLTHNKGAHFTTWLARDNSHLWLKTWLVEELPYARILIVAYDAAATRDNKLGWLDMYCTGENLVHSLTSNSGKVGQAGCPVVLVGHCLGGLVLKELCISAGWMLAKSPKGPRAEYIRALFSNLKGMFFYGTPHNGSLLSNELHSHFSSPLSEEMKTLETSSARRNADFRHLQLEHGWVTFGIGESHGTFVERLGRRIHVVLEASARPYMDSFYSETGDHYEICKPESKCNNSFQNLIDFLSLIQTNGVLQAGVMADVQSTREYVVDSVGRAKMVCKMLARCNSNTIFIVGLSGIGKTTLAEEVFHDISHEFPVKCFISLVNDPYSDGKEEVWRKIRDRLGGVDYLKGKKVLMVLDNVESQGQLDVLRRANWLEGSTSRLLVTTTNPRLGDNTLSNTFEVPYLSSNESRELFLHYAFKGREEPDNLRGYVKQVIEKCDNFPLALKVLGGYLGHEDICDEQIWIDLIDRMDKGQEVDGGVDFRIWARLRPCYDALPQTEKDIFLDIATGFHGLHLSFVDCIWSGCRDSAHIAWINLKRRFLVNVDECGQIWMHEQIRSLGRSIACPSNTTMDKWKRVFDTNATKDLIKNFQGVVHTQGLKLQSMKHETLTLRNTTFDLYDRLEYLILVGVEMTGGMVELPRCLAYLRWKDGSFGTCPLDFTRLEKLAVLELPNCQAMKFLPPSIGAAHKLRWLELEGCLSLTELPDEVTKLHHLEYLGLGRTHVTKLPKNLGKLTKLKHLLMSKTKLTRVPRSVGQLGKLTSLDLSDTFIKFLLESIANLKFLTTLNLDRTKLRSLPESIGGLVNLEVLFLRRTDVKRLPESIGDLKSLVFLFLDHTKLCSLPESIGGLVNLESLSMSRTDVRSLPESIGDLKSLDFLSLDETKLCSLPESIGGLSNLKHLNMDETHVRSLPRSFSQLHGLHTLYLKSTPLETLPDNFHALRSLSDLYLRDTNISMLPDAFGGLTRLRNLDLGGTPLRTVPESFRNLSNLHTLYSFSVANLVGTWASFEDNDLSSLGQLSFPLVSHDDAREESVESLGVGQLRNDIHSLFSISPRLSGVTDLTITGDGYVQDLPPTFFQALARMRFLQDLKLHGFNNAEILPQELGMLTGLEKLELRDWEKLQELPESLGNLSTLERLSLEDLPSLQTLPKSLGDLSKLWTLLLMNLPSLRALPESLSIIASNFDLYIQNCSRLQNLPHSFGHVAASMQKESSTSSVSARTSSDSSPPSALRIQTDSWSILHCLLECCQEHVSLSRLDFWVPCTTMERVMKREVEEKDGGRVFGRRAAIEALRAIYLEDHVQDEGPHETRSPYASTSSGPYRPRIGLAFCIVCIGSKDHQIVTSPDCDVHDGYFYPWSDEESDAKDEESDEDEDDVTEEEEGEESADDNGGKHIECSTGTEKKQKRNTDDQ